MNDSHLPLLVLRVKQAFVSLPARVRNDPQRTSTASGSFRSFSSFFDARESKL